MSKHWTIVTKRNGEIVNKKAVKLLFDQLKDGKYLCEIDGADKRSNPQNRYYFKMVVPLIQAGLKDLGHELTKEEAHEFLKAKFNSIDLVNEETGEVISVPQSTTRLNKEQFSEYKEKIQRWAAEWLQIVIPDPGEQLKIVE